MDSKMYQFPHSLQAISAVYAADKYLKFHHESDVEVHPNLEEYALYETYSLAQVKSCAKCINQLVILIQNSTL